MTKNAPDVKITPIRAIATLAQSRIADHRRRTRRSPAQPRNPVCRTPGGDCPRLSRLVRPRESGQREDD